MENPQLIYDTEKKDLTSDFNEAKFQILRLHILWISCNTLSQSGKLIEWKWKLDTIWRELASDAKDKDKDKEKKDTYFYQIEQLNKKISFVSNNNNLLYSILQEKEIFLRCLQEAVGKGGKKSSGDGDDMDD